MHPKIRKYWEDKGHTIIDYRKNKTLYDALGDSQNIFDYVFAVCELQSDGNYWYRFENSDQKYNESEALRYIKLKAFF